MSGGYWERGIEKPPPNLKGEGVLTTAGKEAWSESKKESDRVGLATGRKKAVSAGKGSLEVPMPQKKGTNT